MRATGQDTKMAPATLYALHRFVGETRQLFGPHSLARPARATNPVPSHRIFASKRGLHLLCRHPRTPKPAHITRLPAPLQDPPFACQRQRVTLIAAQKLNVAVAQGRKLDRLQRKLLIAGAPQLANVVEAPGKDAAVCTDADSKLLATRHGRDLHVFENSIYLFRMEAVFGDTYSRTRSVRDSAKEHGHTRGRWHRKHSRPKTFRDMITNTSGHRTKREDAQNCMQGSKHDGHRVQAGHMTQNQR